MNMPRLLSLALCLPLAASALLAEETVREVGTAFTCYYQNAGDNKHSNSTWVKYSASSRDWTDAQIAAVERALLTWDEAIGNTPVRRLNVGLFWLDFSTQGLGGALASADSLIIQDPYAWPIDQDGTIAENVWRLGVDVSREDTFDIHIYLNTATNYYDGLDAVVSSSGQYDLQTVVTHELGHALGFRSLANKNGTFNHIGTCMHHTAMDALMVNAAGESIVEKASTAEDKVGFSPGEALHLEGTELGVYNPTYWEPASSMTHVTGDSEAVMQHMMNPGTVRRELSESEIQLMGAMGWDMAERAAPAVPEPTTSTLSLLGLAALASRRRRHDPVAGTC